MLFLLTASASNLSNCYMLPSLTSHPVHFVKVLPLSGKNNRFYRFRLQLPLPLQHPCCNYDEIKEKILYVIINTFCCECCTLSGKSSLCKRFQNGQQLLKLTPFTRRQQSTTKLRETSTYISKCFQVRVRYYEKTLQLTIHGIPSSAHSNWNSSSWSEFITKSGN